MLSRRGFLAASIAVADIIDTGHQKKSQEEISYSPQQLLKLLSLITEINYAVRLLPSCELVFSGQLGGPYNTIQVTVADVPAKSAQALGCSNKFIVGSFVTSKGTTHGFITPDEKKFARFDAPGSSQTPAFKVAGTIIKGVNDKGDIVGFFSDGTNVNGFVRFEASVGPQ